MKALLVVLFLTFSFAGISQQNGQKSYFAQCVLQNLTSENFQTLETQLKNNPNVLVVRLDQITNTLFLITKDLADFTATDFQGLMGTYYTSAKCIHIGIRGVDVILPNPNQGCDE